MAEVVGRRTVQLARLHPDEERALRLERRVDEVVGELRPQVAARFARYQVGPVLMRSPQISTAYPVWAYGDGYLWLYDGTTRPGSELLRISLTSGAVLARVSMPDLPRPILAADNDGLWVAPAVNGGGHAVYHVAPGATTATRLS